MSTTNENSPAVRPLGESVERMTNSIYAIVALHGASELTEGQCVKLMNLGSRVEWRIVREQLLAEMRNRLAKDMKLNGWEWGARMTINIKHDRTGLVCSHCGSPYEDHERCPWCGYTYCDCQMMMDHS